MYVEENAESFDTWNLRNDAAFEVQLSKDIYWIPFNTFGKTRYTNGDINKLSTVSIEQQRKKIINLYEAVQLFQNIEFEILSDKPYFITPDGLKWQYQFSPKQVCDHLKGSCCEIAIWLDFYVSSLFDETGYILIQRPSNGHVMNYLRSGNNYYFVDLESHHPRYMKNALKETGSKKDYFSTNFFTNALIKSSSIQNYITYYKKIISFSNSEFSFYRMPGGIIPPIACEIRENEKKVYLSKKYDFEILSNAKRIETRYVDYYPAKY